MKNFCIELKNLSNLFGSQMCESHLFQKQIDIKITVNDI